MSADAAGAAAPRGHRAARNRPRQGRLG